MNGQPHVHTPRITRTYPSLERGSYILEYGDTRVTICMDRSTPTERRIRKAFRAAIKKHDKGSRVAERTQALLAECQSKLEVAVAEGRWPTS